MKIVMTILAQILPMLLGALSKEDGKVFLDKLFDLIEDYVEKTPNSIDNMIVLPLMSKLRDIVDVPDNDVLVELED